MSKLLEVGRSVAFFIKNSRTTDMGLFFLIQMVQKATALVLVPIYAIYLSPYEFGIVSLCVVISSLAPPVVFLNMSESVYFAFLRNEDSKEGKTATALVCFSVLSVVIVALSLLLYQVAPDLTIANVPFYPYLFLSVIFSIAYIFQSTYFLILQATGKIKKLAWWNLVYFGVTNLCIIILINVMDNKGLAYMLGLTVGCLFFGVGCLFVLIKRYGLSYRAKLFKENIQFSGPLIPHALAYWGKSSIDRFILSKFVGISTVGIYHIAVTCASPMLVLIEAFRSVYNELFFKLVKEEYKWKFISMIMIISIGAFSFVSFSFALLSREVLDLLFSAEYSASYIFIPFLMAGHVMFGIYTNVVLSLFEKSKTYFVTISTVSSIIITTVVSYFVIQKYGAIGGAFSFFLSNTLMTLFCYSFSIRKLKIDWPIKTSFVLALIPVSAFYLNSAGLSIALKILIILLYAGVLLAILLKPLKELRSFRNVN